MTRRRATVIVLNYHRIAPVSATGPPPQLHTVAMDVFRRQLERCQELAGFTTLGAVLRFDALEQLNFVMTIDDVPAVSAGALELLRQQGIPHVLSVCGELAELGSGWRDKVYAIVGILPPARIEEAVRSLYDGPLPEPFSFYHFTKTVPWEPRRVIEELVTPLFAELAQPVREATLAREYMSWKDIAEWAAAEPLASIANHSWSHANFEHLTGPERRADILRAHDAIASACGAAPRDFAVPFGCVKQELLLDLTEQLTELGYRSALWTESAGNAIVEPYLNRSFVNLLRLHVAPTMQGFEEQLRAAIEAPLRGPLALLPHSSHREPVEVSAGSDPRRCAALETVLRPDKDYACAPRFYDYAFRSNPYRGTRPDYVMASSAAGPEAIAYAFHSRFAAAGTHHDGIYVASWRRLPRAGRFAGPELFRRLIAREPVVGIYKPSPDSTPTMREWTSIEVFAHRVELPAWTDPARSDALGVTHLSAYSDSLSPLVRAFVAPRFTVARDGDFYRWRVDGYPLAKPTYVVLSEAGEPRAFAVLLTSGESAAITDFIAPDPTWRLPLFDAAFAAAAQAGATIATVETSCRVCSRELVESFAAACERFRNYYLIAPEVLGELPQEACPQGAWDERYVHETHVTGDVLLR